MSKAYISVDTLRRFIENIATAEEIERSEAQYFLAVKDGRIYRVEGLATPTLYLIVTPEEIQWIRVSDPTMYIVRSNTEWSVG